MNEFDVFISYRRSTGADVARTLQQALRARGYTVFFDYDSLRDGEFNNGIYSAIDSSKVFILVLSKGALDRCVNENDWVRLEIEYALSQGKRIVPVAPSNQAWGFPSKMPASIARISNLQVSELNMASLFEESIDKCIETRFGKLSKSKTVRKKLGVIVPIAILFAVIAVLGFVFVENGRHGSGVGEDEDFAPGVLPIDFVPDDEDLQEESGDSIDSDGDGLSDSVEREIRTDPFNPDSDNDGLKDGEEVFKFGTDPLNPDSDYDGLKDGEEVLKFGTDPLCPDSDNDGLKDGEEVLRDGADQVDGAEVLEKMAKIVIPEISFRQTSIKDVFAFLESASREYDDPNLPPEERGVYFNLEPIDQKLAFEGDDDDIIDAIFGSSAVDDGFGTPITLSARYVSLLDLVSIVTDLANLSYLVRNNVVIVSDYFLFEHSFKVVTDFKNLAKSILAEVGTKENATEVDLKALFAHFGVDWPKGSKIELITAINRINVVNTQQNIDKMTEALEMMNALPNQ